jgi:hypothetical protein
MSMEFFDLAWFAAWYIVCFILLPLRRRRRVEFKRIRIPLVRRIYPQLIAEKLCQVQPMLEPAGLVHYLNYRYSTNKENSSKEENCCTGF